MSDYLQRRLDLQRKRDEAKAAEEASNASTKQSQPTEIENVFSISVG